MPKSTPAPVDLPPERINMYCVAMYKGTTLASDLAICVAGSHYYSPQHVNMEYLRESTTTTVDPSMGPAKCWDIVVGRRKVLKDAAFMYTDPPYEWRDIADRIAFRAFRAGDSGFGLQETGAKDGVDVDEAWFG